VRNASIGMQVGIQEPPSQADEHRIGVGIECGMEWRSSNPDREAEGVPKEEEMTVE
jgi:hypothetical protein